MGGQLVETIRNRNDSEDIAFCGGYTMHLERIFKFSPTLKRSVAVLCTEEELMVLL
ncbi:hypothetical protein CHS0354_013607, partial [Potamilus streckersoni]